MTRRFAVLAVLLALAALATSVASPLVASDENSSVTFNKDVLPILQRNCQVCHRPGEAAPMSFLTYESTRPWARAIKGAVLSKKMPPWLADPGYGTFRNAPNLTPADIKLLTNWADNGAPEGNPADKPAAIEWRDGWRIQPDVIVSMSEPVTIQAKGAGEIKTFLLSSPFEEDTWVSSIEVRPGDRSVVHHVIVQVPEQTFSSGPLPGCAGCTPTFSGGASPLSRRVGTRDGGQSPYGGNDVPRISGRFTSMEAVYVPGAPPMDFRFHNSAKLIPGGAKIKLEVHYTPNGKKTSDQTRVGFTLARKPALRRFVMMAPESMVDTKSFRIPAGASNFESKGELTFTRDVELVWFMPHMHLRGKDMTFRLVYPNGQAETVLSARFNFNWQLGYEVEEPIRIPRGTKMIVTAHHDNSANNRFNPDPTKSVEWGELTSQEMMLPWFGVLVDHDADPSGIAFYKPTGGPSEALSERTPPLVRMPTSGFKPELPRLEISPPAAPPRKFN